MTQPSPRDVEQALAKLQVLVRRPPTAGTTGPSATTRLLPLELTDGEPQYLGLLADEVEGIEAAKVTLLADLRFEHLGDADDELWRFIADCWIDRKTDQVPMFIEQHRRSRRISFVTFRSNICPSTMKQLCSVSVCCP